MSENRIGSYGAKALAAALKIHTAMIQLNLWRNDIGDNGAAHLGHVLKVNRVKTLYRK